MPAKKKKKRDPKLVRAGVSGSNGEKKRSQIS